MDDEDIWNKHRDELVRYAAILAGPFDAEDVVSAVVTKVLSRQRLGDLDEPRPYLFRAVLNEIRSRGRRRQLRRQHQLALQQNQQWEQSPPDVNPEVLASVLLLPERQRAAVYLYYWRDLSLKETAQLMGCNSGSVKRYLFQARRRLKESLDHERS